MMKSQKRTIFSIQKMVNPSGNFPKNNMHIFKIILLHLPLHLHLNSISINICRNSLQKSNFKSISNSHKYQKINQLENRSKPHLLITIRINKEINSIIFGIVNSFAQKMKNKKKLHLRDVIQNLIPAIQLQIFLMKKMEHSFVYFLLEDVVLTVLIANIIIIYLVCRIANLLIKIKIFLEGLDLVHLGKT